jgi:hypothetical protein
VIYSMIKPSLRCQAPQKPTIRFYQQLVGPLTAAFTACYTIIPDNYWNKSLLLWNVTPKAQHTTFASVHIIIMVQPNLP